MRWPGRKRYPAGRIGTRTPRRDPGSSASGASCERRWVRLRIPAVTCAECRPGPRPSAGRRRSRSAPRPRVQDDLRDAEDLERRPRAAPRYTSGRATRQVGGRVRARWAVRRRPMTAPRASRRSGGADSDRHRPLGRPRPPRARRRAAATAARTATRSPRSPGCGYAVAARQRPGHTAGNGSGSAYSRSNQVIAGSSSAPFGDPLQPAVEEAHQLMEVVEVRSRRGHVRQVVDPVADDRPRRSAARSLHPERRVDVRVASSRRR